MIEEIWRNCGFKQLIKQVVHGSRGDVTILPTLMINNVQYRGKLERTSVLKAICAGFKESTEPHVCLNPDMETNECLTSNGGCWKDTGLNITACKVIKPKLVRPLRIPVTSCAWDHDGKRIVGGIGDGSIQRWSIKPGWGSRPDIYVENAHADDITGLKFSADGQVLLSRSTDSTLKVWDLRKTKMPLAVFANLPNNYAQTNAAFSPDDLLILTGTCVEKEGTAV